MDCPKCGPISGLEWYQYEWAFTARCPKCNRVLTSLSISIHNSAGISRKECAEWLPVISDALLRFALQNARIALTERN